MGIEEKRRELFEVWAEGRGLDLYCSGTGLYDDAETLWAWAAWRAALDAVMLPAREDDADAEAVDGVDHESYVGRDDAMAYIDKHHTFVGTPTACVIVPRELLVRVIEDSVFMRDEYSDMDGVVAEIRVILARQEVQP